MNADESFFHEHAGWHYDPASETSEQGRERTARELANAEQYAREHGWWAEIEPDPDVMEDDVDSVGLVERGEMVNLSVTLFAPAEGNPVIRAGGNVLGSLGGIVVPSESDPYLRVVAAELAAEAMTL